MTNLFHLSVLPIVKYFHIVSQNSSPILVCKNAHRFDRGVYSSVDNLMTTSNTHYGALGGKEVVKV